MVSSKVRRISRSCRIRKVVGLAELSGWYRVGRPFLGLRGNNTNSHPCSAHRARFSSRPKGSDGVVGVGVVVSFRREREHSQVVRPLECRSLCWWAIRGRS
jgi:hypothetical protein